MGPAGSLPRDGLEWDLHIFPRFWKPSWPARLHWMPMPSRLSAELANHRRVCMFVVIWEPKHGGGGHQVALTLGRAEALHRAVCRAMPEAECRIERAEGFGPRVAPTMESRLRRQEQRQRPRRASRRG